MLNSKPQYSFTTTDYRCAARTALEVGSLVPQNNGIDYPAPVIAVLLCEGLLRTGNDLPWCEDLPQLQYLLSRMDATDDDTLSWFYWYSPFLCQLRPEGELAAQSLPPRHAGAVPRIVELAKLPERTLQAMAQRALAERALRAIAKGRSAVRTTCVLSSGLRHGLGGNGDFDSGVVHFTVRPGTEDAAAKFASIGIAYDAAVSRPEKRFFVARVTWDQIIAIDADWIESISLPGEPRS